MPMKTKLFPAVIFILAQFVPCGAHASGLVAPWGNQNNIQFDQWKTTVLPEGVVNIKAGAAGFEHAVALIADGTVVAWGNKNEGQIDIPVGFSGVRPTVIRVCEESCYETFIQNPVH